MASDVIVKITQKAAPKKLGFGIPLLLSTMETAAAPYAECAGIDEVKAKFGEDTALYKAAKLLLMQEDAPAKIAVCGVTEKAVEALGRLWPKGWRQLILTSLGKEGEDDLKTVAEYVESKGEKMLFTTVKTLEELAPLKSSDLTRLVACWHPTDDLAAALVGATAAKAPGSITYKNTILKGVAPQDLTDEELKAAHMAGALTFVTKAGDNVTSEGITLSGEYIDIVDSGDYVIQQLEYEVQKTLNKAPKVPYDNKGIALLESVTVNVLQRAYQNGIIAEKDDGTPDYTVKFQTRSEADPADRAVRQYLGGSFSFGLAGAIHRVEISGEIVI